MVLFFEAGRLGNQLLQYAVLRQAFPAERLCFFGLQALAHAVEPERAWFVPNRGRMAKPAALLQALCTALAAMRVIGEAWEQRDGERAVLAQRRGLWPGIVRLRPSFFQHASFAGNLPPTLSLRPALLDEARAWLDAEAPAAGARLFLHIRRGDYLHFPDPSAPAAVDDAWIHEALAALRNEHPGAVLVVCSDDLPYARALLSAVPHTLFCDRGETGDLAVMSLCDAGVLSPSTYSWWAACFARRRLAEAGRSGRFIAPRHWVGHRRGVWYPAGFQFDWIEYR